MNCWGYIMDTVTDFNLTLKENFSIVTCLLCQHEIAMATHFNMPYI